MLYFSFVFGISLVSNALCSARPDECSSWTEAASILAELHAAGKSFKFTAEDGKVLSIISKGGSEVNQLAIRALSDRILRKLPSVTAESSWPTKCAWLACLLKSAQLSSLDVLSAHASSVFIQSLKHSLTNTAAQALLENMLSGANAQEIKGPVCVTGANGFLGSHLVLQLLEAGYMVHGTVRDTSDSTKTEHLTQLPGASTRLKLFACDLLGGKEAFAAAMHTCTGVYHTASPFFLKGYDDGQAALVQPAVEGTKAVLSAVLDTESVTRVVLTSSTASVYIDQRPCDHVYDEDDWSDLQYVRERQMHYVESKIVAERTAWGMLGPVMAEGTRTLDLVVIAPTLIIGPMLQPGLNTSSQHMLQLLDGSKAELPSGNKCFVDVRDTVAMHIKAMENPAANGRYLCIAESIPYSAVAKYIKTALPPVLTEALPAASSSDSIPAAHTLWSKEKGYQLGQVFRPVEHSIADTVISLYLKGHMNSFLPEALHRTADGEQQGSAAAQ